MEDIFWEHKSQLLGLLEMPLVWAGDSCNRRETRVLARTEVRPAEPCTRSRAEAC